jgi:hypothetical protein
MKKWVIQKIYFLNKKIAIAVQRNSRSFVFFALIFPPTLPPLSSCVYPTKIYWPIADEPKTSF